jgi:hypothetical protein
VFCLIPDLINLAGDKFRMARPEIFIECLMHVYCLTRWDLVVCTPISGREASGGSDANLRSFVVCCHHGLVGVLISMVKTVAANAMVDEV